MKWITGVQCQFVRNIDEKHRDMSSRRLSRCCETYGGHGQQDDSSSKPPTTKSSTSDGFDKPQGSWPLHNLNRSSTDCSARKHGDDKAINLLQMALTQGCASIGHLHGKQHTFGTTTTIESDHGSLRETGSIASSFSRGKRTWRGFVSFLRFVGPGMVIAVAYGETTPILIPSHLSMLIL